MKWLALVLLCVSCDSGEEPASLVQVLVPTPAKIDFGFVPAGQTVMTTLSLHNTGKKQLHLKAPIVSQAGMGFSAQAFPVQLMPDETLSGTVKFDSETFEGHSLGNIDLEATEFPDSVLVELKADAGN